MKRADDFCAPLDFESEEPPEEYFKQNAGESAKGVPITIPLAVTGSSDDSGDWEFELIRAEIIGEGISTDRLYKVDEGTEYDFLSTRGKGRRSAKRALMRTGTQLSINYEKCLCWAEEVWERGFVSEADIEGLIVCCIGNGDQEELCINLERNLEAIGFRFGDHANAPYLGLWSPGLDFSPDELAEAVEASLNRNILLPGMQSFSMDKSTEEKLFEPLAHAKNELKLHILGSEAVLNSILGVLGKVHERDNDTGNTEFLQAVETLSSLRNEWLFLEGKRRRAALNALETIGLSREFLNEIVGTLRSDLANPEELIIFCELISAYDVAIGNLLVEYLPYVRRVAARNVEEAEDPEDVFQVAFTGLQRSIVRFDPERGTRFALYCSIWMRQALTRWRMDEGASIRLPAHRYERLAKLGSALDRLDVRADGTVSDSDLAAELEWTIDEARQFRSIPREAEYPESIDDWDSLLPEPEEENAFDWSETKKILTDALADLDERQAGVIRLRFGIECEAEMTLEEIGSLYGVTRERIRQIEAEGLRRLRRKHRLQQLLGI